MDITPVWQDPAAIARARAAAGYTPPNHPAPAIDQIHHRGFRSAMVPQVKKEQASLSAKTKKVQDVTSSKVKKVPVSVHSSTKSADDEKPTCIISNKKKRPFVPTDSDVQFLSKRPKKEIDFQLSEMKADLKMALQYSKEGQRRMMEYCLKTAKTLARGTNMLHTFERRETQIRGYLTLENECKYHSTELEENLAYAAQKAREGDKVSMEISLRAAKEHANAHKLHDFEKRAANITKLLNPKNERHYHLREMEEDLDAARSYMTEGNRQTMQFCLKTAKNHANAANAVGKFKKKQKEILTQFDGNGRQRILNYHLKEMNSDLDMARVYARKGDKRMMVYSFTGARENASLAKFIDVERRISQIESIFYGSGSYNMSMKPKSEAASKMGATVHHCSVAKGSAHIDSSVQAHGKSEQERNDTDCDDVRIEKVSGVNELVSNRVKKAETMGEVILVD